MTKEIDLEEIFKNQLIEESFYNTVTFIVENEIDADIVVSIKKKHLQSINDKYTYIGTPNKRLPRFTPKQ